MVKGLYWRQQTEEHSFKLWHLGCSDEGVVSTMRSSVRVETETTAQGRVSKTDQQEEWQSCEDMSSDDQTNKEQHSYLV